MPNGSRGESLLLVRLKLTGFLWLPLEHRTSEISEQKPSKSVTSQNSVPVFLKACFWKWPPGPDVDHSELWGCDGQSLETVALFGWEESDGREMKWVNSSSWYTGSSQPLSSCGISHQTWRPQPPVPERKFSPQGDCLFNFPGSIASSFHNYSISPWKTDYSFWKLQLVSSDPLSQCPAFHGCTFDPLGNAGSGPAGISYRMKINLRTDGDSPGSDSDLSSFTRPLYVFWESFPEELF